ncbi:hypothetical protein ARMA_0353 [Ardenticatena maritima]|uniref:Uncharacterized protein n=1 Tax=Ardenticatena maritima TaxID=872965 RepID=A0A0M9UBM5_9CHLR|nr:hypothetical protein [Ardenticatena maritima]KPL88414.1 hypothetical protein SE16_06285 [Ardenticatena maritima]GAP61930.1 hypothetical protein ARMA_0353 [Ardenticatena maritima]
MESGNLLNAYYELGRVAEEIVHTLGELITRGHLSAERKRWLSEALEQLAEAREGFIVTLRTSSVEDLLELEGLVRHVLFEWNWLADEMGMDILPEHIIHLPRRQLLTFAHSYLTLALMPRLPSDQVTFPRPRTYADIPSPRRPGEVLARLEEVEETLARLHIARNRPEHGRLRRTYGFFETSAWLVRDHRRMFGN